ncbi:hypothetical protein ACFQ4L_06745 [Lapidilactobacillus mulanensis]|uniref:Lipoprotein n=1 Tax=Lapidilactobacillus mulanensis TaxID=2485999 RepID=A0ABW4DQN9_9LACO|nr:hypothetical protein [Lapidilactobacillus mulanensis]
MKKIKALVTSPAFMLVVGVAISCFVLPLLSNLFGVSKAHRILYLFLVIDPLIAFLISWFIRHYQLNFFWLFLFPAAFAISVWWRFAKYNYWLAGIYLVLSLIFYLLIPRRHHQFRV